MFLGYYLLDCDLEGFVTRQTRFWDLWVLCKKMHSLHAAKASHEHAGGYCKDMKRKG